MKNKQKKNTKVALKKKPNKKTAVKKPAAKKTTASAAKKTAAKKASGPRWHHWQPRLQTYFVLLQRVNL